MASRLCSRSLVAILLLVACIGCATRNDVVSSSFIQKRKYRPGWHVDLRSPGEHATNEHHPARRFSKIATDVPVIRDERLVDFAEAQEEVACASVGRPPVLPFVTTPPLVDRTITPTSVDAIAPAPSTSSNPGSTRPNGPETDRPFNWLAPISLLVVVGGAVVGIALASNPIAIGSIAVGFVLALIAARRCRDRGRSGQGFAIAALIISTLLIVLTLLSLATQR